MKHNPFRDSRGVAHLLIVIIVLVVVGAIGFVGYSVYSKQQDKAASGGAGAIAKAIAEASCEDADKNICKFMASWKLHDNYTVNMTSTHEGKTETSVYKIDGDKKTHFASSGETSYEFVVIDDVTYTKASNGVWWKQKATPATKEVTETAKPDFEEDTPKDENKEVSKTTYKNLGTEACGKLTCYKYQVVDPNNTESTELIWFDTKDYQLRKMRSEGKDGAVTEQTYSYDKVTIKVPSPVKDLGPNQYLMPGEAEPVTLPDPSAMNLEGLGGYVDTSTEE